MNRKEKGRTRDQMPLPIDQRETAHVSATTAGERSVDQERSRKADRQEFFIPVTGFVWLYPEEVKIVNHPAFQRLGRVYQLGQTYLVYRGATHKRFEHVLGSLHIAQRMIDATRHTSEKAERRHGPRGLPPSEDEERFILLGALLHDIGHIAAGHTLEDELGLLGKHDDDARLDLLFDGADWRDASGATLAELVDREFTKYVPRPLADRGVAASAIVRLLIRKPPELQGVGQHDRFDDAQKILAASPDIRLRMCRDIIGNTICADLLDYLHRDWYHIGKPREFDERILQYMEVRNPESRGGKDEIVTASPNDDFVVSLGQRPHLRTDAISSILELLEWRYQLAESVLYHRAKLAAAGMLDRALYSICSGPGSNIAEVERRLLPLTDEQMLMECGKIAAERGADAEIASQLLKDLDARQLYDNLHTCSYEQFEVEVLTNIQRSFGDEPNAPAKRAKALEVLEKEFRLKPGTLVMYCPISKMNKKIAEVKIAVNRTIGRFCDMDKGNRLSGGHLGAQLDRFDRLWKVHFFMDWRARGALDRKTIQDLQTAIEKLMLQNLKPGEDETEVAQNLAESLVQREGSPWYGYEFTREEKLAGYMRKGEEHEFTALEYPLGAPAIRRFIRPRSNS